MFYSEVGSLFAQIGKKWEKSFFFLQNVRLESCWDVLTFRAQFFDENPEKFRSLSENDLKKRRRFWRRDFFKADFWTRTVHFWQLCEKNFVEKLSCWKTEKKTKAEASRSQEELSKKLKKTIGKEVYTYLFLNPEKQFRQNWRKLFCQKCEKFSVRIRK